MMNYRWWTVKLSTEGYLKENKSEQKLFIIIKKENNNNPTNETSDMMVPLCLPRATSG